MQQELLQQEALGPATAFLTVYCALGSSAAVVHDCLTHVDCLCHGPTQRPPKVNGSLVWYSDCSTNMACVVLKGCIL